MLNGRLVIHGVDVEAIAATALSASLSASNSRLDPHEREDCLSFLVAEVWRESERYNPSFGSSFSTIAWRTAQRRFVDWQRRELGRTVWRFSGRVHVRQRPTFVSIDGLDASGRDRLEQGASAASNNPEDFVLFIESLADKLDR